jgi:hypothetical protein
MQGRFIRIAGTVAAAVALVAMAPPSDPVGVYGIVDRVVISPDTTTIQIWGSFAVSDQKQGDHYLPAAKGYLYYRLNSKNAQASRAEWADLRSLAGTKTLLGFSAKWQPNTPGRVRCATEAASSPDEYQIFSGMGVVRLRDPRNSGWAVAKDLLSANVPDAPCGKAK